MGDSGVETSSEPSAPVKSPASSDLSCTICLATRFNTECRVNGCSHSFCFACISEWVCQSMRPSCPMCRHEIDQVFYGFEKEGPGRMKIFIMEYRAMYSALSLLDKSQLIGERRVVVRNMMHAHKTLGNIRCALSEQAEGNEELTASLNDLLTVISHHIEKSEVILDNLRSEAVRKNHGMVFANPSFRKMIYTVQIRVKYADYGQKSETRADLARDPERLRKTVHDFLMAEFDVIPLSLQPKVSGISWRTKFLGSSVSAEEKSKFADDVYDLMLKQTTGNAAFQTELLQIFPQIGTEYAQLLDDHLEALVAVNQTDLNEFYNAVFYDSTYNNSAGGFMDLGFSTSMRDERPDRFEIIFQHMHREIPGIVEWEFSEGRFRRQTSNTNGTDRATNNDDSSRSPSPEERVPTPMPGDEGVRRERAVTRAINMVLDPLFTTRDFERGLSRIRNQRLEEEARRREEYSEITRQRMDRYRIRPDRHLEEMYMDRGAVQTSRTIPFLEAHQTALRITRETEALRHQTQEQRIRSLRPTARREQVLEETRQAEEQAQQQADQQAQQHAERQAEREAQRPMTRRDNVNERVRQFDQQSMTISFLQNLIRSIRDPNQRIGVRIPFGVQNTNTLLPVYMPEPGVIQAIPGTSMLVTSSAPTANQRASTNAGVLSARIPTAQRIAPDAPEAPAEEDAGSSGPPSPDPERVSPINDEPVEPPAPAAVTEDVIFPNPSTLHRLAQSNSVPRRAGMYPTSADLMSLLRRAIRQQRADPRLTTSSSSSSTTTAVNASGSAAPSTGSSVESPAQAPTEPAPTPTEETVSSETQESPISVARRTRAARRAAATGSAPTAPPTKRRRGN